MNFIRTYNSQTPNTVSGSFTTWQNLYGNGWTNNLDAHLVSVTSGMTYSVYDVDGARYDYINTLPGSPAGPWASQTSAQTSWLTWDGGCGMWWTKPDGTTYYFWLPETIPQCTSIVAGYAGRLFEIIGPNRNTFVQLIYDFDAHSLPTFITVQTESGMTATLLFGDVNGRRLLQQLNRPDGNAVAYAYDAQGNLTSVTRPANNSSGIAPQIWYGYTTIGSDNVLSWASSPRWAAQCNQDNCGGDGAYIAFAYAGGGSAQASTLASITSFAVVNPAFNDGYAGYSTLQANHPSWAYAFRTENYTTGVTTPTLRDSDGHFENWVVDGSGHVTQTQVCTVTPPSGNPCPTANLLVSNRTWSGNYPMSATDERGGRTDMAYDVFGNLVAVAGPPFTTGAARPTTLIDYEQYNGTTYPNIVAVCDPVLVHSIAGGDWNGQYTNADNYCTSKAGTTGHLTATYAHPAQQPFGEPASVTSPGGYTRTILHDPAAQGGSVDYGLTTKIFGTAITQFDSSTKQPTESFIYDTNGNVVCRTTDAGNGTPSTPGTTVMTYDAMSRPLVVTDPDDASRTGACSGRVPGLPGATIALTTTYYPDGSVASTQSPSEAAYQSTRQVTYDLDGNATGIVESHGSINIISRWFDGMDRLVETQQPPDPNLTGDIPISLRYLYDLSQNGSSAAASTISGATVTAHGNLFDTLKNKPGGWVDFTYESYDAANRKTNDYIFVPCPPQNGVTGAIYCSQPANATRYDWDSSSIAGTTPAPGMLVGTFDAMSVARKLFYDGHGNTVSIGYNDPSGFTNNVGYAYDFSDRMTDAWAYFPSSGAHHLAYQYSADGQVATIQNSAFSTVMSFAYYPDATLETVSATSTYVTLGDIVNQPNLYRYAYRNDGLINVESFGAAGNQNVSRTYTRGGRPVTISDPGGTPATTIQYNDSLGRATSFTTPEGNWDSYDYDVFGNITQFRGPDLALVTSTYNVRGELYARTYQPGGNRPAFQYGDIQGVLVQHPTDQWDGRTGAPLKIGTGASITTLAYDGLGRMGLSGVWWYDGESRLATGNVQQLTRAEDPNCSDGGTPLPLPPSDQYFYYDALGNLLTGAASVSGAPGPPYHSYYWGALQRPAYTVTQNSGGSYTPSYAADGSGSVVPSLGLTVTDLNPDGAIAAAHNRTGHSSWQPVHPFRQWCTGYTGSIAATSGYQDPASYGTPPPDDGTSDSSRAVSSTGRAFLTRAGGYTTPDYSSVTPYSASRRTSDFTDGPCGGWQGYDYEHKPIPDDGAYYDCPDFSMLFQHQPGRPPGPIQCVGKKCLDQPPEFTKHYDRRAPCVVGAAAVMHAVENDFSRFGNYSAAAGAAKVTFFPPPGLHPGSEIPIDVSIGPYVRRLTVTVRSMSSQSMTFTTEPGHLIYPGFIEFAASPASGNAITFNIDLGGKPATLEFYAGGGYFEDRQWDHFLSQVSAFCLTGK